MQALSRTALAVAFACCIAGVPALAQEGPTAAPTPPEPVPATPPVVPAEPPIRPPGEETPVPVEPPSPTPDANQWRFIVIHHSASPSGNAASFDRMHRRKGWDGLAYHFVITNGKGGPDGALQVGARWWGQKHGAHAGGLVGQLPDERNEYNEFGIGICLVGNFEKQAPTRAQMKTLAWLVAKLTREKGISPENVVGHRHVKSTACPGRYFPWRTLYAMMRLPAPTHLAKRYPGATVERCPWCFHHDSLASSRVPALAPRPAGAIPNPDVPPPMMLTGQ